MAPGRIVVLGSFVADLAFRTGRAPAWGETVLGSAFLIGPGGKGSNQAVAAARLGAHVTLISKLGDDPFGDLARKTWQAEGIDSRHVFPSHEHPTGAAAILIDERAGDNAIVVVPGACFWVTPEEIDQAFAALSAASVFLTQLETQLPAVLHGLARARAAGAVTILNPAPAAPLPGEIYPLCDYLTPNETEAAALTGLPVETLEQAAAAAHALRRRGAGSVILTLGARGALVADASGDRHVAAFDAGPVVETTGAGDAFAGGFAVALAEGRSALDATRFACAVAGISVTRAGTAPSMPRRAEVDALWAMQPRPGVGK